MAAYQTRRRVVEARRVDVRDAPALQEMANFLDIVGYDLTVQLAAVEMVYRDRAQTVYQRVPHGAWIVLHPDGRILTMTHDAFTDAYEEIPTDAQTTA